MAVGALAGYARAARLRFGAPSSSAPSYRSEARHGMGASTQERQSTQGRRSASPRPNPGHVPFSRSVGLPLPPGYLHSDSLSAWRVATLRRYVDGAMNLPRPPKRQSTRGAKNSGLMRFLCFSTRPITRSISESSSLSQEVPVLPLSRAGRPRPATRAEQEGRDRDAGQALHTLSSCSPTPPNSFGYDLRRVTWTQFSTFEMGR